MGATSMFSTVTLHASPVKVELITDQVREHRAQIEQLRKAHEATLHAAKAEAYAKGKADAEALMAQEKAHLQDLVKALTDAMSRADETMHKDLESALPTLVIDAVQRIITAWQPDEEAVRNLVRDILHDIPGNSAKLLLVLNKEDFALIKDSTADLHFGEAEVDFVVDAKLKRGECLVRGKFGTRDARHTSKLEKLAELLQ